LDVERCALADLDPAHGDFEKLNHRLLADSPASLIELAEIRRMVISAGSITGPR
jgi:hypothetical protein